MTMPPKQYTPEYTLADLRRVAASCVAEMKRYRRHFSAPDWSPVEAAMKKANGHPAAKAAKTMMPAMRRLADLLQAEAECGDCNLDAAYAGIALDAVRCAESSMKHGGW
jgi:hypothetical protein